VRAEGKHRESEAGVVRRAQVVIWVSALASAVLVSASAAQGPPTAPGSPGAGPPGGPPGLEQARAAKEKHADALLDKPGVVGVAVGVRGNGAAVVKVYKEKADVADIPDELEGVPVDAVVTGVIRARAPSDRFPRPVPIGVSAGHYQLATGTLGARVTDGTNVFILSNNHVIAGVNTASIGDPILQPGALEDGGVDPADRIGTLAAFHTIDFNGGTNTMDAAIGATTTALVGTTTPPDGYGTPSSVTTTPFIGQPVQKYGRTTGFQQGSVVDTNLSVDVCYVFLIICFQEARFAGQISVSPGSFSAPGDSGSLMVETGSNRPVALLFAGGDGLTIGTPIDVVLERFGVTIDGQPTGPGPPSAPTALSATSGDGTVSLAWNAPTFDGGSEIANYNVYRGTSAGQLSLYADDIGSSPGFADTGVVNGTTYYYKVSAENASGEGALSNEAVATPSALVEPDALFALDDFNRPNENPLSGGGLWSNAVNGGAEGGLNVNANVLACAASTTCTAWRLNQTYGPSSEAWARIATLPGTGNAVRLYVRLQQAGGSGYDGYMLRTNQLAGTDEVFLERITNSSITRLLTMSRDLAVGDTLLLRASGSVLEAWLRNGSSWTRLGVAQDATYSAAGNVGIGLRGTTGRLDDFGARTMGSVSDTQPPGPPTNLTAASASTSRIDLDWGVAVDNVGIARYRVERCQGTGCSNFAEIATTPGANTDYSDTNLDAATSYSYRVRAEDTATPTPNVGPYSNTASANTFGSPVAPDPVFALDSFNRANENPLSDLGRWSNAVNGAVENGFHVNANVLACGVTSTCTAWRNTGTFGGDTEAWARVATLPGAGNAVRLYARIQAPGTSGYDGYVLLATQQSGTDQTTIYRITNSSFTSVVTVSQELSAGDTILFRAAGSTLEAWRHDGAAWSRYAFATDATYGAAGYAGVGLRGTTGRLDDFGARTMGAPPPDTEPPSAPGTLTATPFSDSQIELSWGSATDNVGVTFYRVERCEGAGCSNFAEIASSTSTTHMDVGLAASTSYSYRVRALDAAENEGPYSNVASATTQSTPDTEPPTAPTGLAATAVSSSQIDLAWSAATDNVGVVRYLIERCDGTGCSTFTQVGTSTTTSFESSGLTASTSYSYRVRAEDAVPLQGPYSNEASATTQAPPDTEPPSAPSGLTATAISSTQIDLAWTAATDNVGVVLYRIERCEGPSCGNFDEIGTSATTAYSDPGRTPSTSYTYRVRAQDAVPLLGLYSNLASATTQSTPDTEPPTAPTGLAATAVSSSQIDLAWSAATDNVGVVRYLIERCDGTGCSTFTQVGTSTTTSFQSSGLTASTSYTYRVRAEDAVPLQGPYSNEASATTLSAIVPPIEPLPILDPFNRGNENPLSDGGLWSNGIAGAGETGLRLRSNELACTRSTTCTAWRNTTTYGPGVEVAVRVAALPGNNNHIRLLARIQQPGSNAYDGYMLRTNQLSGTDQLFLERIDNGVGVGLGTFTRELANGDVLVLRVQGSTLEAWHRRGATWTLVGTASDSTYGAAGFVGVGLRGTKGRLDDFGAR
jgi:chitodextrinase